MLLQSNFINAKNTAFFLCDMQERFKPAIYKFEEITQTCSRLVKK